MTEQNIEFAKLLAKTEANGARAEANGDTLDRIEQHLIRQNGRIGTLEKEKVSKHDFERYEDDTKDTIKETGAKIDKLRGLIIKIFIALAGSGISVGGYFEFLK